MNADERITLSPDQFERVFPFHFVVDRSLRVVQTGRTLAKLLPGMTAGTPLESHLTLRHAGEAMSFLFLAGSAHRLRVFEAVGLPLILRGQMKLIGDGSELLFIGSPWLTEPSMLTELGLTFDDFAVHDPAIDILQLVQAQSTALADTRRLTEVLTRQRENLRAANERLLVREAEASKLAMIAARTDNAVVLTDRHGMIEWVNDGFTRISGYTLDEVRGKSPGDFLQGEGTDAGVSKRMGDCIRAGKGFREEILNYSKTGRPYWLSVDAQPIHDDAGELTHWMAIERDITEERASQERSRRLNQLKEITHRVLSAFLADGDLNTCINTILAEAGEFLNVSRAYLFRYRDGGLRLSNTHEWCAQGVESQSHNLRELPADQFPWWTRHLSERRAIVIEDVTRGAPDEVRRLLLDQGIMSLLVFPVTINSELQGFIGFDDTRGARAWRDEELTLLQVMVESLSRAIERRVAERDRAATASRLEEALARAESANKLKSTFLANMSHELRTPMTAITGYAGVLQREAGTHEDRRLWAQAIRRNADHLLSLLNDLLDVSKIEAGQLNVTSESFLPALVVSEVVESLRPLAVEKRLAISDEVIGPPVGLYADRLRFRQIIFNLVSNAIKYTDGGSVTVRVCGEAGPDGLSMRVEVIDTGIGIDPANFDKVFQPFSMIHDETVRRAGGIGLGLNISRRLAELLGGTLTFSSSLGKGSTFALALPVAVVPPEKTAMPSLPHPRRIAQRDQVVASQLHSLRILLVEDSVDNQQLLAFLLTDAGAVVEIACNGSEGVDKVLRAGAEGHPFDAVLMDMQMPVMDGYTATEKLRAAGVQTPIIALTAFAMADDREHCLRAGCNDYLSKPIDEGDLIAAVSLHCERPQVPPEASPPADFGSLPAAKRPWMLALKREFVGSLPHTKTEITSAIRRGDFATSAAIAHRLRGVAASFDLPALGEAAGKLDDAFRTSATPLELSQIARNLEDLMALTIAAAAVPDPSPAPPATPSLTTAHKPSPENHT